MSISLNNQLWKEVQFEGFINTVDLVKPKRWRISIRVGRTNAKAKQFVNKDIFFWVNAMGLDGEFGIHFYFPFLHCLSQSHMFLLFKGTLNVCKIRFHIGWRKKWNIFFIKVWKLFYVRCVLKILRRSPKKKVKKRQYLLAVDMSYYTSKVGLKKTISTSGGFKLLHWQNEIYFTGVFAVFKVLFS